MSRTTQRLLAALLILHASFSLCASPQPPASASQPAIEWQSPIGREHPLTGRIWEVATQRFIDEQRLLNTLATIPYVITGESHNNPDHHQLQLRILKALFAEGRRVSVGLEIFTSDDQPALERFSRSLHQNAEQLPDALNWSQRRRQQWQGYQRLIQFAADAGLPLAAMDLSRREAASVRLRGLEVLPEELVTRFGLDQPLPPKRQETLLRDMSKAHCGLPISGNLEGMALAQRTRDATMSERLQRADVGGGALLLVGYGHARSDRGVPYLLDEITREGKLVSLLFASVKPSLTQPADYRRWFGDETLPFDYVWFTPRVDDEDPCERLIRLYRKPKE